MGRLTIVLGLALALAASRGAAGIPAAFDGPIREASERFGIPVAWIRDVIAVESAGRTTTRDGRPLRSTAGAMGLMQLMPGTWRAMRAAHGLGPDPDDPRDNILAGTAYLRAMYDRFGYPGLFAAYNAGPGRYADHLARGTRLPAETVRYMARLANGHAARPGPADTAVAGAPPSVFVSPRADSPGPGGPRGQREDRPGVFFPLGAEKDPTRQAAQPPAWPSRTADP